MTARLIGERRRRLRAASAEKPVVAFSVGERVFHNKFGYGEVLEVEGEKLLVRFETSGPKHVIAQFVEPAS